MSEVDWATLVAALAAIERLGPDASGLLRFGREPAGGIFVERGRICWVAAQGMQRRLRDLLGESLSPATLDRMYERSRSHRLPLGQALVAEGLVPAGELERALRRHSAESLAYLCREPLPTDWSQRAGRGYAPRFTFTALDLLFDTVELFFPAERARALAVLSELGAPGRCGAAFTRADAPRALVPLASIGTESLLTLRSLGEWTSRISQASLELGTSPLFTLSCGEIDDAALVWSRDDATYALAYEERAHLVRATSRHLERA